MTSGLSAGYFGDRFYLDMRTSITDPKRDPACALDCVNFNIASRGGLESRQGGHIAADTVGGFGMSSYIYETTEGTLAQKLMTVDENLYSIDAGTFTITYSGSNVNTYVKIYAYGGSMFCDIYDAGVSVLSSNLGVGYNESSPVTLANLKTSIDAIGVGTFSATIVGTTSVPAAFLDPTDFADLSDGTPTAIIPFRYATRVNTPVSNPFSAYTASRNASDFENASFVNHKNCIYMAFPKSGLKLYKYDSVNVYRAGLPSPSAINSQTKVAAGNISGSATWFYTYIHTDAVGNTIESAASSITTPTTMSSENMTLQIPNIAKTSGFCTNAGVSISNQTVAVSGTTVTLALDDGVGGAHTLVAGDTAYLYNRQTSAYSTYTVVSATALTVTVTSSETIQLNVGDSVSANLRISIYRNQTGGTVFYLVAEIPNNPFVSFTNYTDSTADVTSSAIWTDPDKTQSPPGVCSYVSSYGDNLIVANGNIISYSDEGNSYGSSEVFPSDDNQENIYSPRGGRITGMGRSGNVFVVFGKEFCKGIEGSLIIDQYRVFDISNHIGCVASGSISTVDASLVFLSQEGVNIITNGSMEPTTLSYDIDPIFFIKNLSAEEQLKTTRAISVNYIAKQMLLIFIPCESTSVNNYSNNNSIVLVYNYDKKRWMKWKSVDMTGGAVYLDGELWYSDRARIADRKIWKLKDSGQSSDALDHVSNIVCSYRSGWESFGEPGSLKKARWIKPYTVLVDAIDYLASFTLTIKTYLDYIDTWKHSELTITRDSTNRDWGFPWGAAFGSPLEVSPKRKLRSGKCRSMQTLFEVTVSGTPCILSGWEIFYATPYSAEYKE